MRFVARDTNELPKILTTWQPTPLTLNFPSLHRSDVYPRPTLDAWLESVDQLLSEINLRPLPHLEVPGIQTCSQHGCLVAPVPNGDAVADG